MKKYDVIIIGAGTSGLMARRQVAKKTENYLVVDDGKLGTTCARVGCMPSKVFIQVANDFARRKVFEQIGIIGGDGLSIDRKVAMNHVRTLRDRFVRGVVGSMKDWESKLVKKRAKFIDPHTLDLEGEIVKSEKIIITTGSSPIIPGPWRKYQSHFVDTNQLFELEDLPSKMAVIGLGVIGIELGQALNNLGIDLVCFTKGDQIGGLTDPEIRRYVAEKFSKEMNIHFDGVEITGTTESGLLKLEADGKNYEVEKVLVAIGRSPNIKGLGLDDIGVEVNERGVPIINVNTMKIESHPHIFLAGDINSDRPVLHEAADEGFIAGYNAVNKEECFKRRTPLGITFSEPNIAAIGLRHSEIISKNIKFVTGKVSFEGQGRSIVKLKEQGLLHVYVRVPDGALLGAELHAPDGEHLAHLLAWSISMNLSVDEALRMPFYHPVVEEGLRTALRDASSQLDKNKKELYRCGDPPIR